MDFELAPQISVQTGTFAAVIAPEELMLPALTNPAAGKYLLLYLAGSRSGILPALPMRPGTMDVVRLQSPEALAAAVRKANHTIVFVEHDPSLYGSPDDVAPVARSLKAAAGESLVLLYTPKSDRWFDYFLPEADQVYYFRPPPVPPRAAPGRPAKARGRPGAAGGQATLGGFSGEVS
ncbi:MAG TPA: hypothetical protein VMC42_03835 [Methanoregulaceae archaeon]|nr:hypothetical protein [Methanoregulaceae archaeon]